MADLELPSSSHIDAFDVIVRAIRSGEGLHHVRTWKLWKGDPGDLRPFVVSGCPGLSLFPTISSMHRHTVEGDLSDLTVEIEIATAGTNILDVFRLYKAVRRSIYRDDAARRLVIKMALGRAGSPTQTPLFGPLQPGPISSGVLLHRTMLTVPIFEAWDI